MAESAHRFLQQLAKAYRIQTSYFNVHQKKQRVNDDALLQVLKALQAPLTGYQDLAACWQEVQHRRQQHIIEPVIIAWDGFLPALPLSFSSSELNHTWICTLCYENGAETSWPIDLKNLPTFGQAETSSIVCKALSVPAPLPSGYHQLRIENRQQILTTLIVSAPKQMFRHSEQNLSQRPMANAISKKIFGLFTPVYALHSQHSLGCGDLSDLQQFITWSAEQGSKMVATLPLHAAFLDQPCEFSPYSPISRLFWNELYLDIRLIPEFAGEDIPSELLALNKSNRVAYHDIMKLKKSILQRMQSKCFADPLRKKALYRFVTNHPEVKNYARFRALHETNQQPDESNPIFQYHLYVQWQIQQQLQLLRQHAQRMHTFLYLDMPLGVHRQGYDPWRYPDVFPKNISAGAPPDAVFTTGQNWGISPLNPHAIRTSHYHYFIQCLRTLMPQLDLLRIDHVMNFHRLFWIADGFDAKDGVYVRYHPQEFYAILSLESHRHGVEIVGENLGTVPNHINQLMRKHHLNSLHVLQYALAAKQQLDKIPRNSVAALNTHDMPTFAAFVQALDLKHHHPTRTAEINALRALLVAKGYLHIESEDVYTLFYAVMEYMASSQARYFLINIEDLWLETNPQNIPGLSGTESLNWQRKHRFSLEQLAKIVIIHHLLQKVRQIRDASKTSTTSINS